MLKILNKTVITKRQLFLMATNKKKQTLDLRNSVSNFKSNSHMHVYIIVIFAIILGKSE